MLDLDKEISYIKDQIVDKFHPDKIILFGSASKGEFKEDNSDLDFYIEKEDVPERFIDRRIQVRKVVDYNVACDFIVYRAGEAKKRIKMGDPFITEIYEKGNILYG